jgi:hypothetical protein
MFELPNTSLKTNRSDLTKLDKSPLLLLPLFPLGCGVLVCSLTLSQQQPLFDLLLLSQLQPPWVTRVRAGPTKFGGPYAEIKNRANVPNFFEGGSWLIYWR